MRSSNNVTASSSRASIWQLLRSPLITVLTLLGIELVSRTVFPIPNPGPIYITAVVYCAFSGGLRSGLISAAITLVYAVYFLSTPGTLFQYTPDSLQRLIVLLVTTPAIALMVGILKRRNELREQVARNEAIASEHKLREFIQGLDAIVWERNPATSEFTFVSQRAVEILGYPIKQWLEEPNFWQNHIHPEDRDRATALYQQAILNRGRSDIEFRFIAADNGVVWLRDRMNVVQDSSGCLQQISGLMVDITERKQVKAALEESEERLKLALEAASMGTWDWNMTTNSVAWSKKQEMLFGLTPGTFDGTFQAVIECIHPENRELWNQSLTRALEEKTDYKDEFRVVWPDGSIHWIAAQGQFFYDETGRAIRMIGVCMDISDRKQSEQAIQVQETRFRKLFEQSPLSIQILSPDGRTLQVNQAWQELWDLTLEEIPNYNILQDEQLVVKGIMPYIKKAFAGEASAIPANEYEPTPTTRKHRSRWVQAFIYPVKDDAGNIREVVLTHEDITERKQAEEVEARLIASLQESEQRFRLMADTAPILLWMSGLDKLCYYFNKVWLDFTGRTLEQEMGNGWAENVHPEDFQRCLDTYVNAFDVRQEFHMEYRMKRFDGEYRWIWDKGVPRFNPDGSFVGYIGSCIDISDRKAAEEEAQNANKQITNILESITDAFVSSDIDWRFTYANPQAEKLLAKTRHELNGCNIWEVFPALTDSQAYALAHKALAEQVTLECEEFYPEFGKWFAVRFFPSSDGLSTYLQDITSRKAAEDALRQWATELQNQQAWLEDVMNLLPSPILLIEPGTARVTFANRAADELAGGTFPRDKPGEEYHTIYYCTDAKGDRIPDSQMPGVRVARGERLHGFEMNWHTPEGIRPLIVFADTLPGMHGHEATCALIFQDIKELKNAEEALRQQAEELAQANRMKDEFLATLSHELRSPLNAILGWTQLLRSRKFNEASTAKALETIERNARAQTQLIEDLLDVSRIITGKLRLTVRPVELVSVIEAAVDTVRPAADAKAIQLQTIVNPSAGLISGDSDRLQQVVWNLLTNAIKFTPRGGGVIVRLNPGKLHLEIAVSDTGQGISADFLPYVFERFRQADSSITRSYGGLGLGLALVRHIVELHGGTVRAESPGEGLGATFTVKLPLLVARLETTQEEPMHPTAGKAAALDNLPSLEGLRVVVADDETDARFFLSTVLEQCGATVTAVSSASEALEAVQELKPDVLVSDIGMPNEDGYSLIRKVRSLPPEQGGRIPAAALTAYARPEDRTRSLQAGFQIHLPKPVEPAELATVVASLAGRI
ncbi:PAS domain S-box protein [Microcoleus sp. FACHB-831]|uniref:PAS domain S-box protein n=1 Tax=Microcoleus sp. FACHB-831 TaxID=2692827 RepID=UPI0016876BCF|nr:PAS domain S-box protein [Microcoleus sp. FACHB-831]MBD1920981.1 PAS domain S-box protein [Microcoleus sp. FACHB-831]